MKVLIVLIIILSSFQLSFSQDISFSVIPKDMQLYARGDNDSAEVLIVGEVLSSGNDSISLSVLKNDTLILRKAISLSSELNFNFAVNIHAEFSEYTFKINLDTVLIKQIDSVICGDAFIMNGQSNAEANGGNTPADTNREWLRTFGSFYYWANPIEDFIADTAWGWAHHEYHSYHCNVGMHAFNIGLNLISKSNVPIAIINGAKGGTRISQHQRSTTDSLDLNTIYGRLLYRVQKAGIANKAKAFIWHQGENDSYDVQAPLYKEEFNTLYNSWRLDYPSFEKVYMYQINTGCYDPNSHSLLREVQRQIAEENDSILIMSTAWIEGHTGCHYYRSGYVAMAGAISNQISRDLYALVENESFNPPNIQEVYFSSETKDEIIIEFDMPVVWPLDTLGASMIDYLYLDGAFGDIVSAEVLSDTKKIKLTLNNTSVATKLTYLPDRYYNGTTDFYDGPYIKNTNSIGALSFFEFSISDTIPSAKIMNEELLNNKLSISAYPNPFNPSTIINYSIQNAGFVKVSIYDINGILINELVNSNKVLGKHNIVWNASNNFGNKVASGVYICRIEMNGQVKTLKMILKL